MIDGKDPDGGYIIPLVMMDEIKEWTVNFRSVYDSTWRNDWKAPPPPSRRTRLRWRIAAWRERVGFWIAGYTPSDDDY